MELDPMVISVGEVIRLTLLLAAGFASIGCRLTPPKLSPPPPVPPTGDSVLLFGEEVPSTPEAIRAAFDRRIPKEAAYPEVYQELAAAGFPVGLKDRRDKQWGYTVSAPLLMLSRWGMVQEIRVRVAENAGASEVDILPAKRLPESAILEACPDLRRLPGMPRDEAEALLRASGFTVRSTASGPIRRFTLLYARRWGEASPRSMSAFLVCRVGDDGRIADLTPATETHPSRGFDGPVGMFPNRNDSLAEQAKIYAKIPFWMAEAFGLGMIQWMFLPFSL